MPADEAHSFNTSGSTAIIATRVALKLSPIVIFIFYVYFINNQERN